MATLEKIRSKSVLLFVIIIVALLAFILGDFLTSGRTYFGSGSTLVKAGNAKVDYTEYQKRLSQASEQQRNNQIDGEDLSQSVLQQLLLEKMLQNEYDDLGIKVTDAEMTNAMTGAMPHPVAQQFIYEVSQMIGLPAPSGQAVLDAGHNPGKYGLTAEGGQRILTLWSNVEDQVEQALLQAKFDALVNGLFTANELDARAMYDDVASTRHISYAAKAISSVADADVEVTDADLRAAYAEDKESYRLSEPLRAIDYIMVRIEPSEADRIAGTQEVENALQTLRNSAGTQEVASNPKFVVNTNSATAANIRDKQLKEFIDTAAVGQTELLSSVSDKYTIVKLLGVTNEIDSISVSMISRADGGALDSIYAEALAGKRFEDLVDNVTVVGQDSMWVSLAGPGVPSELKKAFETNTVGQFFMLNDSVSGQTPNAIYRINKRHAPVPFYEFAIVEYTIDPSQETLTRLANDLRTYVAANSSADEFSKNAAESGYTIIPTAVTTSSTRIGNANDSRQAVKWVMNAKKGQVMPVYQDNKQTYLLAVAVKEVNDGDYLPYNSVLIADQISDKALRNKKAAKLVSDYAGKASDVASYAKEMGVEAQEADAMYNSHSISGIGYNESAIQGAIAAAEPGKLVGPMAGNNTVIVFVVTGDDANNREYNFEEYANQFNRAYGIGGTRPMQDPRRMQLLLGNDKIKNSSLNLVQDFAN